MKTIVLLLYFVLLCFPLVAQFSLEGEIRPRAEFRHGYRMMPMEAQKPAGFVSQRTRLMLGYSHEQITTRISFQDVRVWGQQAMLTQAPSLDLHEAWVQVAFREHFSLRAGRQEIRYDNQRFFAINDWNNSGRKHDAVVLRHRSRLGEVHLGAAFNQRSERLFGTIYRGEDYKTMQYLRFEPALPGNLELSFLAVADGYEHPANADMLFVRGTWSAYGKWLREHVQFHFNPAFQHGKTLYGYGIKAFYMMGEMIAEPAEKWKATLGAEWFSGNNWEDLDETYRAFDPLYGALHARQGYMDYFTNVTLHTRGAGLVNPYLKNSFRLSPDVILDADLHLFMLQNNYVHEGITIDKYLGTEIDLTLSYTFNDITHFGFGYSVMFGSESMEIIKGGSKDEFAHWAYVVLRIRPKFL